MATIVITTDNLAPEGMEILRNGVDRIVTMPLTTSPDEIRSIVERENPVGIVSRTLRLDSATIDAAPNLSVISKYGVGYDNIDVEAATARGVPVYVTRGANSQSVAELTFGLMLSVARRIIVYDRQLRSGVWKRTLSEGTELNGGVLGVVGYGMIGRRVAALGAAFGMEVRIYDPFVADDAVGPGVTRVRSLHAMLPECDVLSLHCPLKQDTRGLIGVQELALLKPGAILVNTARGPVVDEAALIASLREKRIAGAGLDTFAVEPLSATSPLLAFENVVLTPHCGAGTAAAARRVSVAVARNLVDTIAGTPPAIENLVNPEALAGRTARPRHVVTEAK